jgi:uridine kinase
MSKLPPAALITTAEDTDPAGKPGSERRSRSASLDEFAPQSPMRTFMPTPAIGRSVIVGIAGGTGSGKSTIVAAISEALRASKMCCLCHDFYYKDISHLSLEERAATNFDHPSSLDTELMVQHLKQLRQGIPVEVPQYDFATHARRKETTLMQPARVILVDGILVLTSAELRELMDIKIFVDTEADIRFIRRLRRDISERGRTVDSCMQQYMQTVKPMHSQFVEPSKAWADVIIPMGLNTVALDMVLARLKEFLGESPVRDGAGAAVGGSAAGGGQVRGRVPSLDLAEQPEPETQT